MTSPLQKETTDVRRSASQRRRRAHILTVAREELTKRGYDRVTMDGLAAQAGVTRKTLYNQYGSKDELLFAAISEILDAYRSLDGRVESGIPAILESRRAAMRQVSSTPAYAEAMTKAVSQASPDHTLIRLLFREGIEFVARQLRVAQERGEIARGVDIEEIAEQAFAHSWGMSSLVVKGVIEMDQLERKSLSGLLLILLGITTGARHRALVRLLAESSRSTQSEESEESAMVTHSSSRARSQRSRQTRRSADRGTKA
jgi:AcrR family transcriptional regulator